MTKLRVVVRVHVGVARIDKRWNRVAARAADGRGPTYGRRAAYGYRTAYGYRAAYAWVLWWPEARIGLEWAVVLTGPGVVRVAHFLNTALMSLDRLMD